MDTRSSGQIGDEQAALRRVAVLVAEGASPEEVFTAVTAEAGQLLDADRAAVGRYVPENAVAIVARWSAAGDDRPRVHTHLGGQNVASLVFESGRPVRMDDFSQLSGPGGEVVRELGIRSSVGIPISVDGPAVGRHHRVEHGRRAAACGCRGTPRRVHGTGRHRDRQRAGPRGPAPPRRRAGRAAAGGDAGRRRRAARGGVRGGRRGSRAVAGRRPDGRRPVRTGRRGDPRRVEQHRRRRGLPRGRPDEPRRAEPDHAGVPDPPAGPGGRLRWRHRRGCRGRP